MSENIEVPLTPDDLQAIDDINAVFEARGLPRLTPIEMLRFCMMMLPKIDPNKVKAVWEEMKKEERRRRKRNGAPGHEVEPGSDVGT